jgi:hypothetical protein
MVHDGAMQCGMVVRRAACGVACGVRRAACGVRTADCGVQHAACGVIHCRSGAATCFMPPCICTGGQHYSGSSAEFLPGTGRLADRAALSVTRSDIGGSLLCTAEDRQGQVANANMGHKRLQ